MLTIVLEINYLGMFHFMANFSRRATPDRNENTVSTHTRFRETFGIRDRKLSKTLEWKYECVYSLHSRGLFAQNYLQIVIYNQTYNGYWKSINFHVVLMYSMYKIMAVKFRAQS